MRNDLLMHRLIFRRRRRWCAVALAALLLAPLLNQPALADLPKVPDGFKIRLVATVPAVQYPCQVATAPDGSLFVGEDPMDQVGPATKPIDRILLFREGKEPVVFADKLNAIFGMVWHDGALYVMNMPNVTVLRDKDGDGKADIRKELFTDMGVPAGTPNDFNDHIVSGLKIGIDGYLYISVGDKGVPKATGPDRRTAQVVGGGVLRCRLDGRGLEVYSTGTRNHLEPNLDDRDNLFTYDNTDDGLGWWTRVTFHVDGGYFGYPHDYHTRTDRMLPRIAEYGGGSPCGGAFYGDDIWPEKYRGCLFWAEWGQRAVRAFRFAPDGASFKIAEKIEFVEPGKVDSFRPLDLAFSHDGKTLYIADWSLGSWGNKTEKLGRVYAVTFAGADAVTTRPRGSDRDPLDAQIRQLAHPAYQERIRAQAALVREGRKALIPATAALESPKTDPIAKRHLLWVVDALAGATPEATYPLFELLKSQVADLRSQAARALGERNVPIAREALEPLLRDPEPSVRLQATIALGRIGQAEAIPALLRVLAESDVYLAYSARQALRRIDDWRAAAKGLDSPDPKVRAGVLLAMDQVYDVQAAGALALFASSSKRPVEERARAVAYLAEVHRKAPPWDGHWWGTQPANRKPPAKTIAWEGTPRVMTAIRELLTDRSALVRASAVEAIVKTDNRESKGILRARFSDERDPNVKRAIALGLGKLGDSDALDLLTGALGDPGSDQPLRDAALEAVEMIGSKKAAVALAGLLLQKSYSAVRKPRVIAALGRLKDPSAVNPLLETLKTPSAAVKSAAIDALVAIVKDKHDHTHAEVMRALGRLRDDAAIEVRNRAIAAAGTLGDREAIPSLIAASETPASRFEASLALAELPDVRALQVYLRGLTDKSPDLRKASAAAIGNIRTKAAAVLDQLAARRELPPEVVPELRSIYSGLVPVTKWHVLGPFAFDPPPDLSVDKPIDLKASWNGFEGRRVSWRAAEAVDSRGQIDLGRIFTTDDDRAAYGSALFESPNERKAEMVVGSDDTLTVWLNGKKVYDFTDRRGFEHEQGRFDVSLLRGPNRVLVRCGNRGGGWQFAVAVTATAEHAFLKAPEGKTFNPDAYRAVALKGQGSAARGRNLFSDLKGLACIKCHSVGKEGGTVGPELSSVGAKYPRDELISSVLFPSAKISSGYEPSTLALLDGRILTGIVRNETADSVEIQDADAKTVKIAKASVDERKRSDVSLMPNGLAQGLSPQDFADLIAYLETLKNPK
jgi:putative membrane-bound dehydrogenase-like protein